MPYTETDIRHVLDRLCQFGGAVHTFSVPIETRQTQDQTLVLRLACCYCTTQIPVREE
jgi:hypothetical protein